MAFMMKDGFPALYYEDTGGQAPVVLFLHGAGGNHLSWWQQVPVFAEEYRCVTVDQRSFGQSVGAEDKERREGPDPAALTSDVVALLDHLDIARAAIVAQSMGGWAAAGAVVHAPQRFWAIVMANTVGNLTNPDIAALREKLAASSPPRPDVPWLAALGETFRREQPARAFLYAQIAGLNLPLPSIFRYRLGLSTTPVERYAATRVPTLFLTSDEDGLIWPELSQKVHEHVPGSRFERVEATGHSTYFERPDVFNREVHAFLKGYRP
ncbi:MAG: alpha/beta hydrolase [Candidatus Rokuibacteriota bacterium]|nr:MAG: alpha/beta hydrolase [Candidatus Rokubacteria bacterium]PYN72051.1 MAG: alpha/beta hydrolase [Candidatus Rokubacteria bacterium]